MPEYVKLLKIDSDNIKKTGDLAEVVLEIPASLPWFDGHFPQQPVLPAVMTTEISDALIQHVWGVEAKIISVAKFKGPILPKTKLVITVFRPKDDSVSLIWRNKDDLDPDQFLADLKFRL